MRIVGLGARPLQISELRHRRSLSQGILGLGVQGTVGLGARVLWVSELEYCGSQARAFWVSSEGIVGLGARALWVFELGHCGSWSQNIVGLGARTLWVWDARALQAWDLGHLIHGSKDVEAGHFFPDKCIHQRRRPSSAFKHVELWAAAPQAHVIIWDQWPSNLCIHKAHYRHQQIIRHTSTEIETAFHIPHTKILFTLETYKNTFHIENTYKIHFTYKTRKKHISRRKLQTHKGSL